MAGEVILSFGSSKALEANGASTTNNSVTQANDASYGVVADGSYFPHARFVLGATFATAPTEGTVISLLARPLNIKSNSDTEVPEATRYTQWIGAFVVNNVNTLQYMQCIAYDVPWEADYYIHNDATGQTISAGWTLDVMPFSFKTA